MRKFFNLLAVAAAGLSILGLASCQNEEKPSEPSTPVESVKPSEPSKPAKPTETAKPEETLPEGAVKLMSGNVSTQFGPVSCDVYLLDDTKAKFDVTTGMESMNAAFDKTGTYTFANNVYTFVLGDKTYTTTYTEADQTQSLSYTIQGDMTIEFNLKSVK